MLRLLRIRNFAIIDALEMEFHPGMNVITGETGAGKSIILDALGLILGERASQETVRTGVEEASVEAMFDVTTNEAVAQKLAKQGVKSEGELLIRRTVQRTGKSKIFINGELATLGQLTETCASLVDLCSQHEHQSLVRASYQLELLDLYGGLLSLRQEVREAFTALRSCDGELVTLRGSIENVESRRDYLKFQLEEISDGFLNEGEEEALLNERRRLLSLSQLAEATAGVEQILVESDNNVRGLLQQAVQRVRKAAELDSDLQTSIDALCAALVQVDEASSLLSKYTSGLEPDPDKLEEIELKLTKRAGLKRKFGRLGESESWDGVSTARLKIQTEFEELLHRGDRIAALETKRNEVRAAYDRIALALSEKRKKVAKVLGKTIASELSELAMSGAKFETQIEKNEDRSADGIDRIQFLFSGNPGEALRGLGKVASGGELSRVLLAIRRTIAEHGGVGVYVFDEIDAGIGGKTATVVGQKLKSLAKYNQILCITHLPQVAAFADQHFSVSKLQSKGRTSTAVRELDKAGRVDELARMLGGFEVTDKSRAHAKELLAAKLS